MATKNISLPPELEQYIDAKVASGAYAHASEVVRDGIRLLMREEADKLEWLRREIQKGIDSVERGESIPADEAFESVKKRGRARIAAKRNLH